MRGFRIFIGVLLAGLSIQAWAQNDLHTELSELAGTAHYSAIRDRLEQIDEARVDPAVLLHWRAIDARMHGDTEQARAMLDEAVELDPDNPDILLARATLSLETIDEAGGFGKLGIAKRARDTFIEILEKHPDNTDALAALVQYDWNAPWIAGGRDKRAVRNLEKLEKLSPGDALSLKVNRALMDEDPERALALSEQLIESAPTRSRRLRHGVLLQQAEQWSQAVEVFQSMIDDYPWDAGAWYQLGRTTVLAETGLAEGETALRKVLELPEWPVNPPHAAALWRLGMNLELQGRADQAREAYRQSLELDPDSEDARNALEALGRDAAD